MELLTVKPVQSNGIVTMDDATFEHNNQPVSTDKPFIVANTIESSLTEIKSSIHYFNNRKKNFYENR